ncbi:paeninodin family lasso peptide [Bacillus songklensis]|uniref:Paeninodin family lasso peptide n=1 Tax=Bacillus songklensis TaxID=1069116 RepID=A0ABV8B377_9BACI
MKKEWQKPVLEVLDVNMTMGHTEQKQHLDKDYEAGTAYEDLTWS